MKQRIITGVIGAIIFLSLVIIGGLPFTIFISILAVIAMSELLKMKNIPPLSFAGIISFLLVLGIVLPFDWSIAKVYTILLFVILLLIYTVTTKNQFTFDHVGFIIVSSVYVGFGFYYFIMTRDIYESGMAIVFFILFIIWATDSGAYFIGRSFGKRKLWPEISPKKTIEGSIGGVISALIVGTVFHQFVPLFESTGLLVLVIFIVAIVGQLGDLVESAFKRHYQVKDSGTLLPGHGGILDRFDSLLFVMPILHLLQLI